MYILHVYHINISLHRKPDNRQRTAAFIRQWLLQLKELTRCIEIASIFQDIETSTISTFSPNWPKFQHGVYSESQIDNYSWTQDINRITNYRLSVKHNRTWITEIDLKVIWNYFILVTDDVSSKWMTTIIKKSARKLNTWSDMHIIIGC